MPYACALAIATTFCYPIRHALVPLFGPGFPDLCVHVEDPAFGRMVIDPRVVRESTVRAREMREESMTLLGLSVAGGSGLEGRSLSRRVMTPEGKKTPAQQGGEQPLQRPRRKVEGSEGGQERKLRIKIGKWDREGGDRGRVYAESGYGTDTDASDRERGRVTEERRLVTSPMEGEWRRSPWVGAGGKRETLGMCLQKEEGSPLAAAAIKSSTTTNKRRHDEVDRREDAGTTAVVEMEEREKDEDGSGEDESDEEDQTSDEELLVKERSYSTIRKSLEMAKAGLLSKEARAAYVLMQLHVADRALLMGNGDGHRDKRRRASS